MGPDVTILGIASTGTWWRVECPAGLSGIECWVTADETYVQASGVDELPVASAPPLPAATPTSAPAPATGGTTTLVGGEVSIQHPTVFQGEPPAGVAEALGHITPGGSCSFGSGMVSVRPRTTEVGQEFCLKLNAGAAVPPVANEDPVTIRTRFVEDADIEDSCPSTSRPPESPFRCSPNHGGGIVDVSAEPFGEWWLCTSPFQPGVYEAIVERQDGSPVATERFCKVEATIANLYVESVGQDDTVTVVLFGVSGGGDALYIYSQAVCDAGTSNAHCYVGNIPLAAMASWSSEEVHRFTFSSAGLDAGAYIVTANPDQRVNTNTLLDPQGFNVQER